jgi:hypothetical protein
MDVGCVALEELPVRLDLRPLADRTPLKRPQQNLSKLPDELPVTAFLRGQVRLPLDCYTSPLSQINTRVLAREPSDARRRIPAFRVPGVSGVD